MANVRVCDRCGKKIAENPTDDVTFGCSKVDVIYNNGIRFPRSYDLCSKCSDDLDEFLKKE